MEEKLKRINKQAFADYLGISRQGLYLKIKRDDITEEQINNFIEYQKSQDKKDYKKIVSELQTEISNLKENKHQLKELVDSLSKKIGVLIEENRKLKLEDPTEIRQAYKQLQQRYNVVSDELIMYYVKYGKEGIK